MSSDWDAFGDVIEGTRGLFGEEQAAMQPGLKKHRAVHGQPLPGHTVFVSECQVCGQPFELAVEYPELVAIKYGVNPAIAFQNVRGVLHGEPTSWRFDPAQNGWTCNEALKCNSCYRHGVDILIEPHEPERLLAGARRRGYINQQAEQQVSQLCARFAQAGQGTRR